MTYKISKHILSGDNVEYISTPNKDSGLFADGHPDSLVIHYTAGSSLQSSVNTLRDPNIKASAHLVIGRDGQVKQIIPFNKIAWHAGASEWQGRVGLNQYSIGIEIDNAGLLTKSGEFYKTWYGSTIAPEDVFYGTHRNQSTPTYWHAFTEAQIECVFEICRVLRDKYSITTIVGHEEIAPDRKIDPGPAFPLDKLRNRLLEDRSSNESPAIPDESDILLPTSKRIGIVTASSLNFRAAPTTTADTISEPLKYGTSVIVLKEQSGWYQIYMQQTGWVKKEYIKIKD